MSFFIQEVLTMWTKASRGAPLSDVRNRCPKAFALSADEVQQLERGGVYSFVRMHEQGQFKPLQQIELLKRWPSVSLSNKSDSSLVVKYKFANEIEGAPSRPDRPAITYTLLPDTLLRVEYNSRDAYLYPEGVWNYTLTVFNIVMVKRPFPTMFLSKPTKIISDLVHLW